MTMATPSPTRAVTTAPASLLRDAPASQLMRDLAHSMAHDRVSVGDLLDQLGERGQGLLLLVLSLPMCIPNIPGISTLFGILLIAPALQMIVGRDAVWMPPRVRAWTFDGKALGAALNAGASFLTKVERFTRPRFQLLTRWPATSVAGVQTLIMALVLILPMWGANLIPGIAVALTGLALLQRDGLAMAASTPVAIGALAWVYFGAKYTLQFFDWLASAGTNFWNAAFPVGL